MPGREIVLANNEIYHVFNRGTASQPVFLQVKDYQRADELLTYYQYQNIPLKYSHFIVQSLERREQILVQLKAGKKLLVEIIAFCLMPNHFHFLLRQKETKGISKFLANFTNSYTRYFNTKNKRSGPLFQGKFKAVRIETDDQLLHVSRYIHLNPYTGYLIKNLAQLEGYPYSSFPDYLGQVEDSFCYKKDILSEFKNIEAYKKFIFNQADYQRELQQIKHLIFEK